MPNLLDKITGIKDSSFIKGIKDTLTAKSEPNEVKQTRAERRLAQHKLGKRGDLSRNSQHRMRTNDASTGRKQSFTQKLKNLSDKK